MFSALTQSCSADPTPRYAIMVAKIDILCNFLSRLVCHINPKKAPRLAPITVAIIGVNPVLISYIFLSNQF